jgi:hypothetical protein
MIWSTIVDAPTAVGTRSFIESMLDPRDRDPARFDRADSTGSSHTLPGYGQWDDDGLICHWETSTNFESGWLPRKRFKEFAQRLSADMEPSVADLLDPFEDEGEE